jgi:membrane-associated phospholipid phosphatase
MRPSKVSLATERLLWATWAVVVLGTILFCILIVDRPLAKLADSHPVHAPGIGYLIGIPGLLLGAALVLPIVGRILRVSASGWWSVVMPFSMATVWTAAAVELVLKRFFGRSGPYSWLEHREFAFHWFAGRKAELASMPSGEAAVLAATLGVLWGTLPRWRLAYLVIGGLEAVGLIWLNWHFASDVVAGAAIGTVGAVVAVSRARTQ